MFMLKYSQLCTLDKHQTTTSLNLKDRILNHTMVSLSLVLSINLTLSHNLHLPTNQIINRVNLSINTLAGINHQLLKKRTYRPLKLVTMYQEPPPRRFSKVSSLTVSIQSTTSTVCLVRLLISSQRNLSP